MIVMKFGGASLASAASIRRVVSIVKSNVLRRPVVVVSAIGNTTDQLVQVLQHASRGESYLAWKLQEEIKTIHFCIAEDTLTGERLDTIDAYLRQTFRDLHVRLLEVCEGERRPDSEFRAWVLSRGEQLSSRIVTAVLQQNELEAKHVDATELILTDDQFEEAIPRYWETYARIRWSLPLLTQTHIPVLGGFIAATEDGRATTLGRGGSDLTASIVGAAINADEIEVWKDVDGLLTWDPKLKNGGYRVKRHFLRRSQRAGASWRKNSSPAYHRACSAVTHSNCDSQHLPACRRRYTHRNGHQPVSEYRQVHDLQGGPHGA